MNTRSTLIILFIICAIFLLTQYKSNNNTVQTVRVQGGTGAASPKSHGDSCTSNTECPFPMKCTTWSDGKKKCGCPNSEGWNWNAQTNSCETYAYRESTTHEWNCNTTTPACIDGTVQWKCDSSGSIHCEDKKTGEHKALCYCKGVTPPTNCSASQLKLMDNQNWCADEGYDKCKFAPIPYDCTDSQDNMIKNYSCWPLNTTCVGINDNCCGWCDGNTFKCVNYPTAEYTQEDAKSTAEVIAEGIGHTAEAVADVI